MRNRFRFASLGLSLLVVLALSCTTHLSPRAVTGDRAASSHGASVASGSTGGGDVEQPARYLEVAMRAQAQAAQGGPAMVQAVAFGESPAVRDLPPTAVATDLVSGDTEGPENPQIRHVVPSAKTAGIKKADGALQSTLAAPSMPAPITSFDGATFVDNGGVLLSPPDTDGAVGPNHFVQQVNLVVRIYNKAGVSLVPPFRPASLWAGVGGQCAASDQGDPIVLYDQLSDRWMLSQFAFTGLSTPPYHQCIAISKTPDPTGAYYVYDFVTAGNEFPDYPKLGVWPDGYYMMVHQFTNGGPFNGTGFYAFDRSKMLVGDPTASYLYFNFNLASHPEGVGGSLPSNVDGLTPPPPGRPNTFAYFTTTDFGDPANGLRLFDFHADFAVPANSTFLERPESTYAAPIPVAAFSVVTPTGNQGRRAVPQPPPGSVTTSLDAITDRLMHRMVYRNFGGYESLVLTHTVGAPASTTFGTFRPGVRYYELRRPLPGGNFAINEQATYAPADGISRWMPSVGMDGEGNIAAGFSVSNISTVFPGVRYAGRLASDPPNGLFQGENTLVDGTGVQRSTGNRWGDYSALTIDPSDDCTFWYTQEYYTAAGQAASTVGWSTRIGSFKVNPSCVSPPRGKLAGTITYCDSGLPAANALVEISDGHSAPTILNGTYAIDLSPGNYSVTVKGPSCSAAGPFDVTVANGGTTTFDACLAGTPLLTLGARTVTGGNGNGVIDKNECNDLFVSLENIGCAVDTGITATLSTSTPEVTVDTDPFPYPDIPQGGSGTNALGMKVSTSPAFLCGTPVDFTLTVNDTTGAHAFPFTLPSCVTPTINFSGSIAAGDPMQTGRLNRDGVASVCGSVKATPPLFDSVMRRYDAYNFTNDGDVAACVTVKVTSGCSTNIFYAVYAGSFDPSNIQTNYRADAGSSFAGTASFAFTIPAHKTWVLVIHEVAATGCASYSGTISGLTSNTDGGGACPPFVTDLSPANVWLGLKNSDDVGTYFDLKAEIYNNGSLIGSGETLNLAGGSSGFNNAKERIIDLVRSANHVSFASGDTLSIKLYARIGTNPAKPESAHRSGTARLWFNDAQADTGFDTTIGGVHDDWYFRAGGGLQNSPGAGPKTTIDLTLDRLKPVGNPNPYKLFGTWTHTF